MGGNGNIGGYTCSTCVQAGDGGDTEFGYGGYSGGSIYNRIVYATGGKRGIGGSTSAGGGSGGNGGARGQGYIGDTNASPYINPYISDTNLNLFGNGFAGFGTRSCGDTAAASAIAQGAAAEDAAATAIVLSEASVIDYSTNITMALFEASINAGYTVAGSGGAEAVAANLASEAAGDSLGATGAIGVLIWIAFQQYHAFINGAIGGPGGVGGGGGVFADGRSTVGGGGHGGAGGDSGTSVCGNDQGPGYGSGRAHGASGKVKISW